MLGRITLHFIDLRTFLKPRLVNVIANLCSYDVVTCFSAPLKDSYISNSMAEDEDKLSEKSDIQSDE